MAEFYASPAEPSFESRMTAEQSAGEENDAGLGEGKLATSLMCGALLASSFRW